MRNLNRRRENKGFGTINRKRLFALSAPVVASLLVGRAYGANSTWSGATDGNWSDATQWSAGVPGYTSGVTSIDIATFNAAPGISAIVIDPNRNIGSITFDTANAAAYTIGSTGGSSLLLTAGGTIQLTAAETANSETVNAPLIIEGATYNFINNNVTNTTALLNFGGQISGGVSGTTTLTVGGNNLGLNTISGNIVNGSATTFALTKTGNSTWVLTGANTYTGTTTISTGTLQIGNGGSAGSLGTANVVDNATLAFNRNDATYTVGNVVSGSGGITQLGSGILQLTGANTYTGATTITAGTVQAGAANVISSSSVITFGATGTETFDLNGFNQSVNALNATQTSSTISMEGATLTTTNTGTNTFNGSITGTASGALIKNGTGIQILGGTNTYGGTTTVNSGTLEFTTGAGSTSSILVNAGAATGLAGTADSLSPTFLALINPTSTGGLDLSAADVNAPLDFTPVTGNIGGSNAAGMSIGAASAGITYTGTITPAGGNYRLGGGGTLTIGGSAQANQLTGNNNVEITNGGVVSLANAENYTGTTTIDNRGILLTSTSANLGTTPAINFNNGTLRVGLATFDPSSIPLTFQAGGGTIDTNGLAVTMANTFGGSGAGSFTKAGSGTLTLTGTATNTGGTIVSGGTLQIGSASASGALGSGPITINSGDNLVFDRSDSPTISNNISGAGGLQQIGAGTLTLSGNDSAYTGTVTVNNATGILKPGAANSLGSGANTLTVTLGTLDLNGFSPSFATLTGGANNNTSFITNSSSTLSTLTLATPTTGTFTASDTFTGNMAIVLNGIPNTTYQFNSGPTTSSNTFTYTGGVTINSGGFRIQAAEVLGTGPLTFNGGQLIIPSGTLAGGATPTIMPNNIIVNTGTTSSFGSQQGTWTANGNISGGGTLTFDPPTNAQPNVVLAGNNTGFTGTLNPRGVTSTSANGDQRISLSTANGGSPFGKWGISGGLIGGGIGTSIAANATIGVGELNSGVLSGGRLYNNGTTANTTTTYQIGNLNTNSYFPGAIQNNGTSTTAGVTAITKVGTGTLTIGGSQNTNATANSSNSFTGATTLNSGTLAIDFDLTATTTAVASQTTIAPANINGALVLGGGTLSLTGRANVAASQSNWTVDQVGNASITMYIGGGSLTGLSAGMSVTDLNSSGEIPAGAYITSIDPANNVFTVSAANIPTSFPVNGSNLPGQILSFGALSGVTSLEAYTGTTVGSGASAIGVNAHSASGTLLALGGLTHATGGTVNFSLPSGAQSVANGITTTAQNTNSIIGGYATVGGTDWAVSGAAAPVSNAVWTISTSGTNPSTVSGNQPNGTEVIFTGTAPGGLTAGTPYFAINSTGTTFQVSTTPGGGAITLSNSGTTAAFNPAGNITALPSYNTDSFTAAANNTDVTVNDSPAAFTVNTLRFNNAGKTLALTGTNTVSSGGILVTSAGTGSVITGGSLEAGSTGKELFLTDNSSLNLTGTTIIDNTAASALTVSGSGTTTLGGANTYTGVTTINQGVLSAAVVSAGGSASSIGESTNVATNLVLNGGTLQYTGGTVSTDRLFSIGSTGGTIDNEGSGAINFNNTGAMGFNGQAGSRTLTLTGANTGTNTLAALIGDQSATLGNAVSIVKNGANTWALTGTNTYTGGTTINGGLLQANTDASLGVVSYVAGSATFQNGLTINNGTYETTAAFSSARAITVGNANSSIKVDTGTLALSTGIVGTGGLTTTGSGILALNGTNSYTGNTKVNAGTLLVNGSLTSTSSATVAGGALLGGIGLINSATGVAVNSSAGINLVDGQIGTLTVNNGLSFAGADTFNVEVSPTSADLLNLGTSALSLTGTTTVNVSIVNGISPGTYTIASYGGGVTGAGSFSLATTTIGPNSLSLHNTGTAEQLVVTGPASLPTAYWSGNQSTTWNTLNGTSTNWATNLAGTIDGNNYPTTPTDVIFSATDSNAHNTSLLTTTLGQDFSIHSLTFAANVTGGVAVTGANSLTIGGTTTSTLPGLTVASGAGAVAISNTTLTLGATQTWTNNSSNGLVVSANITGNSSAALTLAGSGMTVLSGASNYAGGTTLASGMTGTVQLGSSTALGTGALTVNAGTLDLDNQSVAVTAFNGAGGLITNTNNALATLAANSGSYSGTINDSVTGQVAFVKNSAGTLALGGTNNYSGGTTINGGVLQISTNTNLGAAAGSLTINAGTLETTATINTTRNISVGSSSSGIQVDNGLTYTVGGNVTGTGALTLSSNASGSGMLILNGTGNNYQGGTTINAGTLQIGNASALGTGGLTVNSGLLDLNNNSISVTSLAGSGGIISNNGGSGAVTLTINEAGTTSFSGGLQNGGGTLSVVKTGAGILTLGGTTANPLGTGNYSDGLTISGGQVVLTLIGTTESINNLGTGTITINDGTTATGATTVGGGVLNLAAAQGTSTNITNNIVLNGGTMEQFHGEHHYQGTITVGANGGSFRPAYGNSSYFVVDGDISGSAPLTLGSIGSGDNFAVAVLTDANDYTGTFSIITAGTNAATQLWLSNNSPFSSSSAALSNATVVANSPVTAAFVGPSDIVFLGDTATLPTGSAISHPFASITSASFGALGGAGPVVLQTNDSSPQPVTLTIGGNNAAYGSGGTNANAGNSPSSTFSGVLSGPGNLIYVGSATQSQVQTLSGANTYTGGTTVNGGTLSVANTTGSGTGTGDVTLNGGTFASGTVGTITGNLLAGSGPHTIAPGGVGTIGSLTAGGITTSGSSGNLTTLNFDLGTGPGTGDLLTLTTSNVTFGTGTAITFPTPSAAGTYELIGDPTNPSVITSISSPNSVFTLPAAPAGDSYSLDTTTNPGFIDLDVIGTFGPATLTFTGSAGNGTWDINNTTNFTAGSGAVVYHDGDNVTFNDTNNGQYNITLTAGPGTATNAGSVSPTSVTVNTAGTYTFGGVGLAGTGTLTKTGVGTLVLNNINTYSGATSINQGTVTIGLTGSISNSAITVGNGTTAGTLNIAANISATAGLLTRSLAGLSITSTGTVNLANAAASASPKINSNRTILVTPSLTITTGGTLNLGSNDMLVHSGVNGESVAATITSEVVSARGTNGLWAGTGITSSAAAASPSTMALAVVLNDKNQTGTLSGTPLVGTAPFNGGLSTFDGQSAADGDVLVKYTYYGDALLTGSVTSGDYLQIDNGFSSGTLKGWYNGDFNNDGVINGDDYTLIDNAYNSQGTVSFAGVSAGPTEMIASDTSQIAEASSSSSVPEPTTLGMLGIGAVGLLLRRRRRL